MNEVMIQPLSTLLLSLLLKGTVLLLGAALASRILRRASAATRHIVWSAAIGGVLLLPMLLLSLPHWNLPVVRPMAKAPAPKAQISSIDPAASVPSPGSLEIHSHATPPALTAIPIPSPTGIVPTEAIPSPARNSSFAPIAASCLIVWLVGFLAVLSQLIMGLRRIGAARQMSVSSDERVRGIAGAAARQIGIARAADVFQSLNGEGIGVPVTWGAFRPTVLLPHQCAVWSEDCLRAALLHEFAHIRRWDWLTQMASHVACALYWFHPLVWLAARRVREESERACDDLVLMTGMPATDYAERLVEVVRSMPDGGSRSCRTVAIAMAQPSEVEGRLKAVLAKDRDHSSPTRGRVLAIAVTLGVMVVSMASLRLVIRAEAAGAPSVSPLHKGERRADRGILKFVYLRDVACDRDPNRPIQIFYVHPAGEKYRFIDKRTGVTFPVMPDVLNEFANLVAQGVTPRPGASLFRLPHEFRDLSRTSTVYFTKEQRQALLHINQEPKEWKALMSDSPVIITDADIQPPAIAHLGGSHRDVPSVSLRFTPEGTRKFAEYSTNHTRELMGIFVDGRLFSMPTIMEPILDGQGEIAGFQSLAEAEALAKRLNAGGSATGDAHANHVKVDQSVTTDPGYSAAFANGYRISLIGITKGKRSQNMWEMLAGPWWSPSGNPIDPLMRGSFSYSVPMRDGGSGSVPYLFEIAIHTSDLALGSAASMKDSGCSYFVEPMGAVDPFKPPEPRASNSAAVARPAADEWPYRFERATGGYQIIAGGDQIIARYSLEARSCAFKIGIATGPWRTVASRPLSLTPGTVSTLNKGNRTRSDVIVQLDDTPSITYYDQHRKEHLAYFLGNQGRLANVARRVVAVDFDGRAFPLKASNTTAGFQVTGMAFDKSTDAAKLNPTVNLARIKELQLQTRPYEIAEFRNVQLRPHGP